jgi:DNA-binding Xre family transcriptional regulator
MPLACGTLSGSMVKLRIKEIANSRGITTAYQLQKAAKLHPSHAARLWKGTLEMIGLKTIDSLCEALACEPSDLIVRVKGQRKVKR